MEFIKEKLRNLNIDENIIERYNEPHRFYHNLDHIRFMIAEANRKRILTNELFLAIIFHDIIYDPKSNDNEEKSVELLYSYIKNDKIGNAILDTKAHQPRSILSEQLCELDLYDCYNSYENFINFENKIFKEYQYVNYEKYKIGRLKILNELNVKEEFINYVKYRTPKIGLYVGSFNPFHKGHYNILEKSEDIFDKVIIGRGINPNKDNIIVDLPYNISNREIINYNGLLTDLISSLNHDVTMIRGLRNANDLEYETTQYRYLQDLMPNIKLISLFCDVEYSHISSGAIRYLSKYNKENKYLL